MTQIEPHLESENTCIPPPASISLFVYIYYIYRAQLDLTKVYPAFFPFEKCRLCGNPVGIVYRNLAVCVDIPPEVSVLPNEEMLVLTVGRVESLN